MPPRTNHRPTYTTTGPAAGQQRLNFDAAPEPAAPAPRVEESAPAYAYGIKDGYRNPYNRVVDWVILDPHGTELAKVTTKRGAKKLVDLLNAKGGQDGAARGATR